MTTSGDFLTEVTSRLARIADQADDGPITEAAQMIAQSVIAGGVLRAFGTGHSEGFAMELCGRAGGLIPSSKIALRDVVVHGGRSAAELGGATLERDPGVVDELFALHPHDPRDVYVIASNSGLNASVVGLGLKVREAGNPLIAVTSLEHTNRVAPRHPSGKRLCDLADVTIDNLAPFGDLTLTLGDHFNVGAVSSMTAAFIAQLITICVTKQLLAQGISPPLYISANIPEGDDHNNALLRAYDGRLRNDA